MALFNRFCTCPVLIPAVILADNGGSAGLLGLVPVVVAAPVLPQALRNTIKHAKTIVAANIPRIRGLVGHRWFCSEARVWVGFTQPILSSLGRLFNEMVFVSHHESRALPRQYGHVQLVFRQS